MQDKVKIAILWCLTICGLACHSLMDLLPIFWGKNVAIATEGVVPQGMIAFMATLTYLVPLLGILALLPSKPSKALLWGNFVLAALMALFNIFHACAELPMGDNAAQYVIMPAIAVVGVILAWLSFKLARKD